MNIEYYNFAKLLKDSREELTESLSRCLDHGKFILGGEVLDFEKKFASKVEKKHCVGVSNGTDALTAILLALDLPKGSEVIVPAFTFIASATVILKAGLKPVFVDVEKDSFSTSLEIIERACTKNTSAVIFVHLFGEHNNLNELSDFCNNRNIHLIEDCAQSFGAPNAVFGIASSFSFFPAKNLGCLGDGGAVVTDNQGLDEKIRKIRKHGTSSPYKYELLGGNYRLDALQAAFLQVLLPKADAWIESRRRNARGYIDRLADLDGLFLPKYSEKNSFNQFTLKVERRDDLKNFLLKKGIPSAVYYPEPISNNSIFDWEGSLPETERICKRVLSIPVYPGLTDIELEYVADNIRAFFK